MSVPAGLFITALRMPASSEFAARAAQDFYWVHKFVYRLFAIPDPGRAARPLFRFDIEGKYGWLYIQSLREPDWTRHAESVRSLVAGTSPLEVPASDTLLFRLLARPTYRIGRKDSPSLGIRTAIVDEPGQREWLERKGVQNGFVIEECILTDRTWFDTKENATQPNGDPKPLLATQFDGVLRVTDRDKLVAAIRNGIGTQKAYGFGLLSVATMPAEHR